MKTNPIFNHDFNKYQHKIVELDSKQKNKKRLVITTISLLLSIGFFFSFYMTNSSATQNIDDNLSAITRTPLQEPQIDTELKDTSLNTITEKLALPEILSPNPEPDSIDTRTQSDNVKSKSTQAAVISKPFLPKSSKTNSSTQKPSTLEQGTHSKQYTILKGDNLASIFKKHSLSKNLLHKLIYSTEHGKQLARIKPGQEITFILNDKDDSLKGISLHKNKIETLTITGNKSTVNNKDIYTFISTIESKQVEKRQKFVNVTITNSLFLSATKAGLSEGFTMELAHLFGWDIDFALEIRNGDSFSVLFNEHYIDDKKVANGQILVAEFINQGKSYQTIHFTDKSGKSDYYNAQGYSKRKAFLRTPVAFSRISSRFSNGRRHPILNKMRAHKGVDYAAPRGTPVKSAGDGKISFRGRKGGYGKVIQIKHGSKYMTVYAHLSSFNRKLKRGSKVKQGQIIAYVGSTGLATGPHLHYEFRVNGVHRNPLTVKLPKANPINKKYLLSFLQHSDNMIAHLTSKKHKQLAFLKK